MCHAELLTDLAQIARRAAFVCITHVRLITFRSAIFERSVRISSCTPSVKKAFAFSSLRFSNGRPRSIYSRSNQRGAFPLSSRRTNLSISNKNHVPGQHRHDPAIEFRARSCTSDLVVKARQWLDHAANPAVSIDRSQRKSIRNGKPIAAATMIQRTTQSGIWKNGKTSVATCTSSHALAA